MRLIKLLAILAAAKLLTSCGIAEIGKGNFQDQKSKWIVPILTSRISVESISQLADLKFSREVSRSDLISSSVDSADGYIRYLEPKDSITIGPLSMEAEDDFYEKAKSDTAVLRAIINNTFPFEIAAGTIVEIYNRRALPGDNGIPKRVYRKVLERSIKPNGIDSLDIKENKLLGWIDNKFDLYLKGFSTPGSNGIKVGSQIVNPMKITFKLIVLRLNVVELNQGKIYNLDEISELRLDGDDAIKATLANFTLFIKNGFPADYNLQAYFLAKDSSIVDSLIKGSTLVSSPGITWRIDTSTVIKSSVTEKSFSTDWNQAQFDILKSKVRFLKTQAKFRTPSKDNNSSVINLRHEDQIGVTLTGKFDVIYDLD